MFGLAEGYELKQDLMLESIDSAFESEAFEIEDAPPRYRPSPRMVDGWDSATWWVRQERRLLDLAEDHETLIDSIPGQLVPAKKANDRSVIERIEEAIRLQESATSLMPDEFELVDILTSLKGF